MNEFSKAAPSSPPVALTIAGSDSSAGAGIQADLKTFAAHQVYGVCAVTALVAEVPGSVEAYDAVESTLLASQLKSVASAFHLTSIKTGMLASEALVSEVVRFLKARPHLPVVVDPVFRAGAGKALLSGEGLERLKGELLPLANLVTPNLPEAEILLGGPILSPDDFRLSPRRLHERYGCDFLVKGGHFHSRDPTVLTDHAWIAGEPHVFSRPRLSVPDLHGTGCTLSAAIAAQLAHGHDVPTAVSRATLYLAACMGQHFSWGDDGASIEALNHFPDGVEFP